MRPVERIRRGLLVTTAGVAPPTPIEPVFDPGYFDDFEVPGSLNGRPNWELTDVTKNWQAIGGVAKMSTKFAAATTAIFGPAGGFGADLSLTVDYDLSPSDEPFSTERVAWRWWWVDANNYLELVADIANKRFVLRGKSAGADITWRYWDAPDLVASQKARMIVQVAGGKMRMSVGGKWLKKVNNVFVPPYNELDLTPIVSAVNRAGRVSLKGATFDYTVAAYIAADSLRVTLDQLTGFVARNGRAATSGTLKLGGTYTGAAQTIAYRIVDDAGAQVAGWTPVTDLVANAGRWDGAATLPVGGPWTVEIALQSGGKWYWTHSTRVLCGALILYYGQSNAVNRVFGTWSGTPSLVAVSQRGALPAALSWGGDERPVGGFVRAQELSERLSVLIGIPVACAAAGQPGAGLGYFVPGQTGWANFTGTVEQFGKPEVMLWDQGEGDADGAAAPTDYASQFLTALVPAIRAYLGDPALPILPIIIGKFDSATPPNGNPTIRAASQRDVLHQQVLAIEAAGHPIMSWGGGRQHVDSYHYTDAGYIEAHRREALSAARFIYGRSDVPDGAGPRVIAGARAGAVISLDLDMRGWTGLTGAALTGYQVSADNFATMLTISSAAVVGNQIVLTLAAAPGGAVKVRSFYGWSYDDSSLAMGTYTGPLTGIDPTPVFPIILPLVVS